MYHFYRQIASAYLKTNYKNAKFITFSLFIQVAINDIGAKIFAPLEMMEIKISFYLLTAYQILRPEGSGGFKISALICFLCCFEFDKGTADEVLVDSPSAVFFVYSGVNFENIIGKRLDFLWIQSCNIANSSEYYVFFCLHFNVSSFGVLAQNSPPLFVIFEFRKRPQ